MRVSKYVQGLPLRPLAAAFALALALDAGSAFAGPAAPRSPTVQVVTNCDDSGPGSLRDAIGAAGDGDTIDLTQLACSVISLTTGTIPIAATDLTLQGPGAHQLMIQGNTAAHENLLYDIGGGVLSIHGVDLSFGNKYRSTNIGRGGCVYTNGDLDIRDSHIYACGVHSDSYDASGGALYAQGSVTIVDTDIELCGLTTSGAARGGGVFAHSDVVMLYSSITGCRNATSSHGYGGGVYAGGGFLMKYSTLGGNQNNDAVSGEGGGAFVKGSTLVYFSTISGNSATVGGGILLENGAGYSAVIGASTISGNTANAAGGVMAGVPLELKNSTIAFNTIARSYTIPIGYAFSAGLAVRAAPITVTSTIIANNIALGTVDDPEDVGGDIPIAVDGSANLIMSSEQPVPPDTITDDPRLAPLADNGGLTRTHRLFAGSPAIDHGTPDGFDTDQRGPGFARVQGAEADIGAYEVDPDLIFRNGFD
ncbi:MAG TPA: choice-of-anchor Q domain-containing protein [Rhodanobacteraceae bacterium]|nr:choice-of-anchor Q domain-containing protein [Rhodanobacteraceae bacterium]